MLKWSTATIHVEVEVVLEAVDLLVPAHRLLERGHRVAAAPDVVRLAVDAQRHLAAGGGGEAVFETGEVARDQGEEVGGLGEGILPAHPVATPVEVAAGHEVAVREEHRIVGPRGPQGGREAREHVGPVGVEGDAPEVLGLALRAEDALRLVQALERGVAPRVDARAQGQAEGGRGSGLRGGSGLRAGARGAGVAESSRHLVPILGAPALRAGARITGGGRGSRGGVPVFGNEERRGDDEAALVEPVPVRREGAAVEGRIEELEIRAVEDQRGPGRGIGGAPEDQGRGDHAPDGRKVEVEVDRVDQERRRLVVPESLHPS